MYFHLPVPHQKVVSSPFSLFLILMFFVTLADAIMSYLVPLVIERVVGSVMVMGVILSTSSVVGLTIDFLFAKYFPNKTSLFFLKILFLTALAFPFSLLLSHHPLMLLFAMAAWGVYFEAMMFANFHMVHELVQHHQHAWAWGMLSVIRNIAYVVGPLFAALFSDSQPSLTLLLALVFFAIAIYIAVLLRLVRRQHWVKKELPEEENSARSFGKELSIWWTFERVLWPLIGFLILIYLVESAFFSIGPLFAESLKDLHPVGGVFVSLYSVPGLVVGFLLGRLSRPFGKKRLAFLCGMLAGLGLVGLSIVPSVVGILFFTVVAGTGMSLIGPALQAVFEDYVARVGKFGNDLIGLTSMAGSISYILGPTINGMIGELVSPQFVFGFWGGVILLYSILMLIIVKRKIRMPQQQLAEIVEHSGMRQSQSDPFGIGTRH